MSAIRRANPEAAKNLCLKAQNLTVLVKAIRRLKRSEFPRRKIYQVLADLKQRPPRDASGNICMAKSSLDADGKKAYRDLVEACGHEHAAWHHLAELWDYVGEESQDAPV